MSANTKTKYGTQSKYLPAELVEIDLALERIMQWNKWSLTITQGSFSGGVAASAGTHNGADGQDLTPNEEKAKEKFLRILGCMHYIRPAIPKVWSRHNHGGRDYSTGGSAGFKAQLAAYHRRENALANRGRDTGYRMMVFPKHVYKGYIGYVQATTNATAWEQQTKASKALTKCVKNQITYVVAETEVSGQRWYITLTGKCLKASEWKKIAQPKGATPEKPNVQPKAAPVTAIKQWYKVTKAPAYGRVGPGVEGVAKKGDDFKRAVGFEIYAVKRTVTGEGVFVCTAHDTWYAESSLTKFTPGAPKPPAKPPAPVAPVSVALNVGTRNVIFRRLTPTGVNPPFRDVKKGLSYADRVPLLAQDIAAAKLQLVGTQEAGTYAASDLLAAGVSLVTKKPWDNILHGDNAGDICQGILWDTTVFRMLSEGKFDLTGTDHDWLVWTEQQIIVNGVKVWFGVLHSEYRAGGTSSKGNQYDKRREQQSDEAMKFLLSKAGPDDVVILTGDFNSSFQNAYDGPGKAAKANGFVDAETAALQQIDTEYNSYHGDSNPKKDSQYDRFFIRKAQVDNGKVLVKLIKVLVSVATRAASDHWQVHIEITVRTK